MLGFFRRIINSKIGLAVTFVVLGLVALAFAAGDVTGLAGGSGGGITGGSVATVGKAKVTPAELRQRVEGEVENYRQQQPDLTMATYVAQGGFDGTLQRVITSLALEQFGRDAGMVVSKRAVDGQIASIPGLQGPTGKFDDAVYRRILAQRKLTDAQVRGDIERDTIAQQLTGPTIGAAQVPAQLALPYASLMLEKRAGQIAVVPAAAVAAGPAPTAAQLQTFYTRNIARYSVPERRIVRYAIVTPDQVRAQATPSEAEIAQQYRADAARYAATEKRDITQVVVLDRAGAEALATKVRGGTSLADAARAAGLEASTQTGIARPAYATLTSPAVADAVFAAPRGALVGPVRGGVGFVVARTDKVEAVAARPLAAVRAEIAAALTKQKTVAALGSIHDAIDDSLADSATFDEVIADRKLAARTTPAITATGVDPTAAAAAPDPAIAPVVTAAFQAAEGDAPQMVTIGQDGSFALVGVGRILPAAPRPLAQVRDQVASAFVADRARQAARRIAAQIVAKANAGTPLARAVATAGVPLPAPRPLAAARADLARDRQLAQGPVALLFAMAENKARLVPTPDGTGWLVVRLDRIDRGNAAGSPQLLGAARGDLARLVGREYTEQFARAARNAVGVKTDQAALARVRAELLGEAPAGGAGQ